MGSNINKIMKIVTVKKVSGIYKEQSLLGNILPLMFYYPETRSVLEETKSITNATH